MRICIANWLQENCLFSLMTRDEELHYAQAVIAPSTEKSQPPVKPKATISKFDIVFVKSRAWGIAGNRASDNRPALVTEVLGNDNYEVAMISSAWGSLYEQGRDFILYDSDTEFSATKLMKSSFIKPEVRVIVKYDDLISPEKMKGRLTGGMLSRYLRMSGD